MSKGNFKKHKKASFIHQALKTMLITYSYLRCITFKKEYF